MCLSFLHSTQHKSDLSVDDFAESSDDEYDDLADYEGNEHEELEHQDASKQ